MPGSMDPTAETDADPKLLGSDAPVKLEHVAGDSREVRPTLVLGRREDRRGGQDAGKRAKSRLATCSSTPASRGVLTIGIDS